MIWPNSFCPKPKDLVSSHWRGRNQWLKAAVKMDWFKENKYKTLLCLHVFLPQKYRGFPKNFPWKQNLRHSTVDLPWDLLSRLLHLLDEASGDMGTAMYFSVVAINSDIVNVVFIYIYTIILYDKYWYSDLQGVYIYIMDTYDVTS